MELKDKPATPTPGRLLGFVLIIGGGVFVGHFFWTIATYSPSLGSAAPGTLLFLLGGILGGAVLVGVGMAAVLHSSGQLSLPADIDWDLSE